MDLSLGKVDMTWKTGLVVALVAVNLSLVGQAAHAETSAKDVRADSEACYANNDGAACERAYDGLTELSKSARKKKAAAMLVERNRLADVGCAANNGWLCNAIGDSYRKGSDGRSQDYAAALSYYDKACSIEFWTGCARGAVARELGEGTPRDIEAARALYLKSCAGKSLNGCTWYADFLLAEAARAETSTQNAEQAAARCADTALHGPSCLAAGVGYYLGINGVDRDADKAKQYFSKGCGRARYAASCYMSGLRAFSSAETLDWRDATNKTGAGLLENGCKLGDARACEFLFYAGQPHAWNNEWYLTLGHYGRCRDNPTQKDCDIAGDTLWSGTYPGPNGPVKIGGTDHAMAYESLLTDCRLFNSRCIEVADRHLQSQAKASMPSPNLAIGILESSCERGNDAACARKDAVVAETGGVVGSYIDPMLPLDERFLLARFDMESGDLQRGRETMQWLAALGHTGAEMELALAYEAGLPVEPKPTAERPGARFPPDRKDAMWELFESAASKGVADAAIRIAYQKLRANQMTGVMSYPQAIGRALYLGANGAQELDDAVKANQKERAEASHRAMVAMNNRNIEARDNMDRQTVQRAWDQYAQRQKEQAELEGGQVCGTVYGPGNSTYRTCMSRKTANKYYRGNY
jgi:TPR repeat protein